MTLTDELLKHETIFLDSAPVIYIVEKNPVYIATMRVMVSLLMQNQIQVVTSPITLTECLIYPYRTQDTILQKAFEDIIVRGKNTLFFPTNAQIAKDAALLRTKYNLTVTDAVQVATAIEAGCGAILTNDKTFSRVIEIPILVVDNYLNTI